MLFEQTLPRILPAFQFTWNPTLGAYDCIDCIDALGHHHETSLTACSCAVSVFCGAPCAHSLELLAQAEGGALTDGPASVAGELDRMRAVQEALIEEISRRAWDYALTDPEPGAGACLFCGGWCGGPLVGGWVTVCSGCLTEGCEDE